MGRQVLRIVERNRALVYRFEGRNAQQHQVLLAATRRHARRVRGALAVLLAAAHFSSVFLPTSSMQPHLVPPVTTQAFVVSTAALRPRWKEATSRLSRFKYLAPPVTLISTLGDCSFHARNRVSVAILTCSLSRSLGNLANLAGGRSVFGNLREPAFSICAFCKLSFVLPILSSKASELIEPPCRRSVNRPDLPLGAMVPWSPHLNALAEAEALRALGEMPWSRSPPEDGFARPFRGCAWTLAGASRNGFGDQRMAGLDEMAPFWYYSQSAGVGYAGNAVGDNIFALDVGYTCACACDVPVPLKRVGAV